VQLTREQLITRALARREMLRRKAQTCAGSLAEYILKDRQGLPIHNAPHHWDWHRHFDEHPLSVLISPVEHGKTQQIAVARTLSVLGQNPNAVGLMIGNTAHAARDTLRAVRQMIEESAELREVYPHLRRSSRVGDAWSTDSLTVERDHRNQRDATLKAWGAHAKIQGARADFIIVDDVLNHETTASESQRKKLLEWFESIVNTRLVEGGVIWVIGTPWHPEDLLHTLAARPAWHEKRYSAVENPNDPPEFWRPIWPQTWPLPRLLERQQNTTPSNFQRKYLCRVTHDGTARFKSSHLRACGNLGRGVPPLAYAPKDVFRAPMPTFVGMDLGPGSSRRDGSGAVTAYVVLALQPDGRRRVLEVDGGPWTSPEIIERLELINERFTPQAIMVESNATQVYITQMAEAKALPVRAFFTGKNKWHPELGVEALSLGFQSMRYIVPTHREGWSDEVVPWADEQIARLMDGCANFDPSTHTSDYLMALWFAERAVVDYAGEPSQRMAHGRR